MEVEGIPYRLEKIDRIEMDVIWWRKVGTKGKGWVEKGFQAGTRDCREDVEM